MKKSRLLGAVCALSLISGQAAAALLDGETINYQYYFPNLTSPYSGAANGNYVVGAGVEINNVADSNATMDISDTNIYIDYLNASVWSTGDFNGFVITDALSSIPSFTSVTIDPATNMSGFDASRITFDSDHIWVNWNGLSFDSSTIVSLNVNAVPIPATLWLFGSGLLGLAGMARRKKA